MSMFEFTKGLNPGRSKFDLSYSKKFTTDFGKLYPVDLQECYPGDYFKLSARYNIKTNPLLAPIMQTIDIRFYSFFTPTRKLWKGWTKFITGGKDGRANENSDGTFKKVLPRFTTGQSTTNKLVDEGTFFADVVCRKGTLWDAFGFPTIVKYPGSSSETSPFDVNSYCFNIGSTDNDLTAPLAFPWFAYHFIHNEYFRDENLAQNYDPTEFDIEEYVKDNFKYNTSAAGKGYFENATKSYISKMNSLLHVAYAKDYFTSALPFQQRGSAPAMPVEFDPANVPVGALDIDNRFTPFVSSSTGGLASREIILKIRDGAQQIGPQTPLFTDSLNNIVSTFNIADLRLATQLQLYKELSARVGVRYKEHLEGFFGVSPRDERLQRPEYIGGLRSTLNIGEIYQSVDTNTSPLGSYAGRSNTNDSGHIGNYLCTEYGYIMTLMCITPRANYSQGIPRQFLRRTQYDFYNPLFSHLSEQGIENAEIFSTGSHNADSVIFGYQGIYDELRVGRNMICGDFRDTFNYWHLGRQFSSAPNLNEEFITVDPSKEDLKRIFAVQNVDPFLVQVDNIIEATRPMPTRAIPGMLDHAYGM